MSILNFLNKNHLAFIEEIVRNPFNSQHELAQIMKLSSRTIRNYVNHINRYSIEMGFEIIKTDNHYSIRVLDNRKYLVLLDYYSKEKKIKYDYNYLSDRISWYLYNFIFLENNLSIDDCSNKLNVSRSTVQSDLKRLNSLASEFNIEIKTHRQKGIILYGDETNIRLFALNNLEKGLKERIDNNQQILSTLTLKIIREKIINELEVKSKGSAREQTLYDFINLLIISILRVKNGHHIKELDFKYLVLIGTNEYKIVEDIFESHFPTLNANEYQQDIAFLATTLVSERNNIDISGIQNMNQLKSLIKEINCSLEKQLGIHLNSDNALITNLENHLAEAIYRVYYDLPIYNPLTEDITFSYPFPFYIAQLFVLELEKYLSISFPNDEIAYLALHFSLFKDNQNNLKNIEKVILISDENESINLVISKNIKSALPFVSELNITSKINVQNYNMDDYDVVFTTEDQAYVTHKTNNTITIKPTFSSLEIITLINQKYHEEIFSEMIGNVNDGFGSFHMSVPEENFFILNEKTYTSGLNQMLKRLTDLNQINEESIGSLMERENSNPSYFSNNLAFPHIVNANKDRFVLSIGVFENPVQIDDRSVSVIVLLLVPDDETMSSHMITIYDELIKVFHNKQYIESISLVNSFSDFNALTTN